jgi:hypothetical protein
MAPGTGGGEDWTGITTGVCSFSQGGRQSADGVTATARAGAVQLNHAVAAYVAHPRRTRNCQPGGRVVPTSTWHDAQVALPRAQRPRHQNALPAGALGSVALCARPPTAASGRCAVVYRCLLAQRVYRMHSSAVWRPRPSLCPRSERVARRTLLSMHKLASRQSCHRPTDSACYLRSAYSLGSWARSSPPDFAPQGVTGARLCHGAARLRGLRAAAVHHPGAGDVGGAPRAAAAPRGPAVASGRPLRSRGPRGGPSTQGCRAGRHRTHQGGVKIS